MQMLRWMYEVSKKDRETSEELRKLDGVESQLSLEVVG